MSEGGTDVVYVAVAVLLVVLVAAIVALVFGYRFISFLSGLRRRGLKPCLACGGSGEDRNLAVCGQCAGQGTAP